MSVMSVPFSFTDFSVHPGGALPTRMSRGPAQSLQLERAVFLDASRRRRRAIGSVAVDRHRHDAHRGQRLPASVRRTTTRPVARSALARRQHDVRDVLAGDGERRRSGLRLAATAHRHRAEHHDVVALRARDDLHRARLQRVVARRHAVEREACRPCALRAVLWPQHEPPKSRLAGTTDTIAPSTGLPSEPMTIPVTFASRTATSAKSALGDFLAGGERDALRFGDVRRARIVGGRVAGLRRRRGRAAASRDAPVVDHQLHVHHLDRRRRAASR